LFDGLHPECAIGTHTGEDDCERFVACSGRSGSEEDVDCGSAIVDWRRLGELGFVDGTYALNGQMIVTWRDDTHAVVEFLAVLCFVDLVSGEVIDPVRHGLGKEWGDVLSDGDGREISWKAREQGAEGFHAACGGADDDQSTVGAGL
jgi:hypothetical protein